MAAVHSSTLFSAQWKPRSLNKQPSADNLPSFSPPHPTLSATPVSPTKSRFNISSVIRFGTRSKKSRATDIIQDPPDHLYAIPIPASSMSVLQRDESDLHLDTTTTTTTTTTTNPRFSRGVSSTSGASSASTDGPFTPSDDPRVSYQHSVMPLSELVNPFSLGTKLTNQTQTQTAHFPPYADDKRHSTHSDKSLGRRIKERLNGDRNGNKTLGSTNGGNNIFKPPDFSNSSPLKRNEKTHVRERSLTLPPTRMRSGGLADMSSDKQNPRAEPNHQEKLNTPPFSPIAFQHPFVMAEAIPATLLDAHASAHPRKLSDSMYYSNGSFGTTMSGLSRSPTILSTSTSKSAPAPGLNFGSPLKGRVTRGSVGAYSSIPALSTHSSVSSLKASLSQVNLKRGAAGSVLNPGPSSGSVSPRNGSPHPPPTISLPPTPSEAGSETPDVQSPSSSIHRVPVHSASGSSTRLSPIASGSKSSTLTQTSSESQHLTPTLKPIVSGSTVSLSTISSLSFAVRPSTYGGSNGGSRSRSASRSGSASASIPAREEEDNSRVKRLSKLGPGELSSMIDMTADSEEESEIDFGDEEDILRESGLHQLSSNTASKTNTPSMSSNTAASGQPENQGSFSKSSFVRALTSSTVGVLRKRSFHHSTSSSSSAPQNSVSATASALPLPSSTTSLSASSPDSNPSNPTSEANSSCSHPYPSIASHPSSFATHHDSTQVHKYNSTQSYTPSQLQSQQQHQSQAQRHMRTLRHHNNLEPSMGGNGGSNVKATLSSSIANAASSITGANVGMDKDVVETGGKLGTDHEVGTSLADGTSAGLRGISRTPPILTTSQPALYTRNPTGRSPATSIHSLQLQMHCSEIDTNQAPQPSAVSLSPTAAASITSSSPTEKRKLFGSKREKKSELGLPTVAEPSDTAHYPFPARLENTVLSRLLDDSNDDTASTLPMRSLSPKIDIARPILTAEEISRIGEEDTVSYRRRAKSSWGSNTASIANTYLSGESVPSPSRYRSSGLMRHAISSSDLYNSANREDGLLVVVRNEFNDGDPNFTSLPAPPRKKSSAFSNTNGVNSLGMENGKSRGREDNKEKKEKKERDKSRKRSRSKSKSKSKGDETSPDDFEPSFLDMGTGRNVILTFEGDKEVVWDGEPISTIGLPPKPRGSSGRHHSEHRRDTETAHSGQHDHGYRHPYGYTEPLYTPSLSPSPSPFLSSPSLTPLSPYRHHEDSFLELSRGHDSVIVTKADLHFVRPAIR